MNRLLHVYTATARIIQAKSKHSTIYDIIPEFYNILETVEMFCIFFLWDFLRTFSLGTTLKIIDLKRPIITRANHNIQL